MMDGKGLKKERILAIVGPTAVGKTAFSIEIAKAFSGEIISCDSMQLYEYMDIGSAKPSLEEMEGIPHHMIGVIDPKESFSAAQYKERAIPIIEDILSRGKLPMVVGGTGLYLDSIIYDFDFAARPEEDESFRNSLYALAEEEGPEALFERLKELDPQAANRVHPNNIKRVVRAIESAKKGQGISDFSRAREREMLYDPLIIGLTMDREQLYDRINLRVDNLMDKGLLDEVKGLMEMGLTDKDYSMQGIGYKELIRYFNGEYDLDMAIYLIKRNSRHYAKRQLTWFKRYDNIKWFDLSNLEKGEEVLEDMTEWIKREL